VAREEELRDAGSICVGLAKKEDNLGDLKEDGRIQ
jgi:hypothetical protein